ncbi:WD40-repeat-containing domain protein [Melanogaster broomeanus]|nr:WD40-repeat-containing domain protein [Melanogaster broomeanus]
MVLQETILCATAAQPSGSGPNLASGPGALQTSSAPHCNAFVETKDGQGGIMLAAQSDKSVLNVYNFQRDQIALKIILPEKLTCLALDQRAGCCAGGTSQGRIYLWEVASGILYNSWDAHYRQVNVLKFTHDGTVLISASEDSGVSVWSVSKLVDEDLQNDLPLPQFTLPDHTLPVTDIVCGLGPFPKCRVLTSSIDHTVKLWDLASQSLITTFYFPKPISSIVWDITERLFFASSPDGSIYQVNLFRERGTKHKGGPFMEAVGGAGVSDVIRIDEDDNAGGRKRLIDVGQPVTALSMSLTTSLLLVGTATGLIQIYDIASHQLLRTISTHKGMSISFLATMLKPPDLVGHISLSLNVASSADAKDVMPVRPVVAFHRMKDGKAREAHEVMMMLPVTDETSYANPCEYDYPESEVQRDLASFVLPTEGEPSGVLLPSRVAELETEVQQLREQLGKAKGVNDVMWETVVQRVLKQGKVKGKQPEGIDIAPMDVEEEGGRSRKRGRQ